MPERGFSQHILGKATTCQMLYNNVTARTILLPLSAKSKYQSMPAKHPTTEARFPITSGCENMACMPHTSDYDPIKKSRREANRFNVVWFKNGEKMTWIQRIGFAVISLSSILSGFVVVTTALKFLRDGNLLSVNTVMIAGGFLAGVFFLSLRALGIRNVLRF
jgi:hypothetical protein